MLTEEEKKFVAYWEENRYKKKQRYSYFIIGLTAGLVIGIAVFGSLLSGWYERANMVANVQGVAMLPIAIIIIAAFMAYFYQNFKWEQMDAQYLSLKAKEERDRNKESTI